MFICRTVINMRPNKQNNKSIFLNLLGKFYSSVWPECLLLLYILSILLQLSTHTRWCQGVITIPLDQLLWQAKLTQSRRPRQGGCQEEQKRILKITKRGVIICPLGKPNFLPNFYQIFYCFLPTRGAPASCPPLLMLAPSLSTTML